MRALFSIHIFSFYFSFIQFNVDIRCWFWIAPDILPPLFTADAVTARLVRRSLLWFLMLLAAGVVMFCIGGWVCMLLLVFSFLTLLFPTYAIFLRLFFSSFLFLLLICAHFFAPFLVSLFKNAPSISFNIYHLWHKKREFLPPKKYWCININTHRHKHEECVCLAFACTVHIVVYRFSQSPHRVVIFYQTNTHAHSLSVWQLVCAFCLHRKWIHYCYV